MKRSDFLLAAGMLPIAPDIAAIHEEESKRSSIRLAFLTDMHVKEGDNILEGTSRAFRNVHSQKNIDFIVNGGDAIMDALAVNKEGSLKQWSLFKSIIEKENRLPLYHCIGNHDVWGWFIKENRPESDPLYGKQMALEQLGLSERYYSFQKGNWHFIILDSTQLNPAGGYIAQIDEVQLRWLQQQLDNIPSSRHICIMSHIPILSICAGLFFDKNEPNGDHKIQRNLMHSDFLSLKKIFNKHKNIKVCLSGHIHLQDEVDYLGIRYYCNGAVSGNWWKGKFQEFDPAYAIVELFKDGTSKRTMINY